MNAQITNLLHSLKPVTAAPTVALNITTATTLAAAGLVLDGATLVVQVQVEGADVRMCPEGTTPTSALGQLITVGQWLEISRATATTAKWYSTGAAVVQVSQYTN